MGDAYPTFGDGGIAPPLVEFNAGNCFLEWAAGALEVRVTNRARTPIRLTGLNVESRFIDALGGATDLELAPGQDAVAWLQIRPRSAGRVVLELSLTCRALPSGSDAVPGPAGARSAWGGCFPLDVLKADEPRGEVTLNFVQTFHGNVADSVVNVRNQPADGSALPLGTNDLLRQRPPDRWLPVALQPDRRGADALSRPTPANRPAPPAAARLVPAPIAPPAPRGAAGPPVTGGRRAGSGEAETAAAAGETGVHSARAACGPGLLEADPAPIRDKADALQRQADWALRCGAEVEWASPAGVAFRLIPPGRGLLGAADGDPLAGPDERPRVPVTLRRPLYVARFPLTHDLLRRFLRDAGGVPGAAALGRDRGFATRSRDPVADPAAPAVCLSAADAEVLCAWMSGMDGRTYRLPTEAEWEYAARAGSTGPWWWSDSSAPPAPVAGGRGPAAAGAGRANAWGLIDVLGNVWEWTASEYRPPDERSAAAALPAARGGSRALRGGGWRDPVAALRLSRRRPAHVRHRAEDLGLRLVCEIDGGLSHGAAT